MADLLVEHVAHQIGRGPHSLADLGPTDETAAQTDVNVPVFVGANPSFGFHVALADHWSGMHGGVDFVAGAIEKAGVDESDTRLGGTDALFEIECGAALFVHDPDLHRVGFKTQDLFDLGEDVVGEGNLSRPVHLRFDHIDRTVAGVAIATGLRQIVHGA